MQLEHAHTNKATTRLSVDRIRLIDRPLHERSAAFTWDILALVDIGTHDVFQVVHLSSCTACMRTQPNIRETYLILVESCRSFDTKIFVPDLWKINGLQEINKSTLKCHVCCEGKTVTINTHRLERRVLQHMQTTP